LTVEPTTTATPKPDRTWTASLRIPAGVRNGGYGVIAFCLESTTPSEPDSGSLYYVYIGSLLVSSPKGQLDPVVRLAGADRIDTAIAASQDVFKVKGDAGGVVISRADSYADALAGSALAQYDQAPLLLTGGDSLDPRTEAELIRLMNPDEGGEVAVLGGSSAIGANVVDRLVTLGYSVHRYAGANRYDTAVKIADVGIHDPSTILLADGTRFTDGLIASAASQIADQGFPDDINFEGGSGGAVLLTNGATMPPETAAYLEAHGASHRYAIGAPAAAAAPGVEAIAGESATATSLLVADRFFPEPWGVAVASGKGFADALAGGAHAPRLGAPLILLDDPSSLADSVTAWLASRKTIPIAFIYGGTAAVSDDVLRQLQSAIS
jgi:putative cell wall-binding protein